MGDGRSVQVFGGGGSGRAQSVGAMGVAVGGCRQWGAVGGGGSEEGASSGMVCISGRRVKQWVEGGPRGWFSGRRVG